MGATQIPPGSALAVRSPQARRRRKVAGPRMLGYAGGGLVGMASKVIEVVARAAGSERAKAIKRAEESLESPPPKKDDEKKVSAIERGKRIERDLDRAERGYATGGVVRRRRRVAGPRRLGAVRGYEHGGVVKGKEMTIRIDKETWKGPPAKQKELLDRELDRTGKNLVRT